jgi:hypothetical protein
VDPVDDAGWFGIVRSKYLLIPIQIEGRTGSIEGKVKNLDVIRFKIFGMNPVSGMGSAHDDCIGFDPGFKGLPVLERIMRVYFPIHPAIHQKQNGDQDQDKEEVFSIKDLHADSSSELEINKGLVIVFPEKDKK